MHSTPTGLNPGAQRQLLSLLCEHAPAAVAETLGRSSQLLSSFFTSSERHIRMWFGHFHMGGISHFKYGARALANFALAHRWGRKRAHRPMTVARQTAGQGLPGHQ